MADPLPLSTCPFCGGKAHFLDTSEVTNEGGIVVECKKCLASTAVVFAVKDDPRPHAASLWNSRAALAAPPVEQPAESGISAAPVFTGIWRCSCCGEMNEPTDPSWRWDGVAWEHKCGDPQSGHSPARYFGTSPVSAKEEQEQSDFLLEALVAARNVIVTLTNTLGIVPGQNGYSTRMTEPEMIASQAIQDLDSIISRYQPNDKGEDDARTGTADDRILHETIDAMRKWLAGQFPAIPVGRDKAPMDADPRIAEGLAREKANGEFMRKQDDVITRLRAEIQALEIRAAERRP